MKPSKDLMLGLSLSAAFVAGCVVRPFLVPPAHAAATQRWDYFCFSRGSGFPEDIEAKAKMAGQQGWELVTAGSQGDGGLASGPVWCFKRPL